MDDKKKVEHGAETLAILIVLAAIVVFWPVVSVRFNSANGPFIDFLKATWVVIEHVVVTAFDWLFVISIPLSLFFFIGIIYSVEGLKVIREKEKTKHDLKIEPAYDAVDQGSPALTARWDTVMKHIESSNENDWKQAIIDADIILDDLLTRLEYRGLSIGEKLQRVAKGDMKTLQDAWDAHKVRNEIAHEGSAVSLNQLEAKRVINLYKKVFEEFYFI